MAEGKAEKKIETENPVQQIFEQVVTKHTKLIRSSIKSFPGIYEQSVRKHLIIKLPFDLFMNDFQFSSVRSLILIVFVFQLLQFWI